MPHQPGEPKDPEGFEEYVRRELRSMNIKLEEIKKQTIDHERTLYGHEDDRRRLVEPGLVQVVGELASAFKDVRAVAKAGWAMLGLVGFSTAVSLFSIFVRVS